jgi:hypothetical protein
MAECNGELYAAIRLAIYKRVDGLSPSWQKVYEHPNAQDSISGIRGLTAIPNPKGSGEVLLMAPEGVGANIMYLNPADNSVTTELNFDAFLTEQWGAEWENAKQMKANYVIAAFNDMTPLTDPQSSEALILIGIYAYHPKKPTSTWYVIRHEDASYTLHEIPYLFDWHGWPKRLFATRTIRVSPFASDNNQVIYVGGYSTNINSKDHNTAWIYSADIGTVLGE